MILYLAYRWATAHPGRLRRAAERIGSERLRVFIRSPAGHWLRRRVSPRTAYGLVLTSGLALIGLFSWVFGAVLEDVVAREPLVGVAIGAAGWYLWSLRPEGSWGGSRRAKAGVGLAAISVMLLVGVGRVYEGAAYPSDVLAGWAVGGLWASVCLTSAGVFRRLRTTGEPVPEAGV